VTVLYVYIDSTTEIIPRPFYVGIGNLARVRKLKRVNPRHTAICKAYGQQREVVLMTTVEQIVLDEETTLIALLKTLHGADGNWGANHTTGGEHPKLSLNAKEKISQSSTGRFWTDLQKEKLRQQRIGDKNPMFGRTNENSPMHDRHDHVYGLTAWASEKRGKTLEEIHGDKLAHNIRENLSHKMTGKNNPFFGKHHSEETKKKISERTKGKSKPLSEEGKQKRIEANKRRKKNVKLGDV